MESSSNLHLHHHQQELLGGSSSLPSPSFPLGAGIHQWNQDLILNNGDFSSNARVILPSSKDFRLSNEIPASPLITHMFQDLGFHWAGNSASTESYTNNSTHQANLARIKDEYLSETFPNLNEVHRFSSVELDERLLLRSLISSGLEPPSLDPNLSGFRSEVGSCGRGNYSMVLPTADVSIMNSSSSTSYPISLGMDLLASARFGRSQLCEPVSLSSMGLLGEDTNPFGPTQVSSRCSQSKASSLSRGNNVLEPKASQAAAKKPRLESTRSLCSAPIKVRKEKLGDRIAALQQLVAPFGKTDTASVLMEAIGYIKFLQGQVETLSVPYMTLSNKKLRTSQGESFEDGDEPKPDLSSRGLCLVPLSCTSYVTNENGGVWSPPNYSRTN